MTIGTLGQALDNSWGVHIRCQDDGMRGHKRGRECGYRKVLDMETLVCTRGRDFPLARLAERLRCPRCGCRQVTVMFEAPTSSGRMSSVIL